MKPASNAKQIALDTAPSPCLRCEMCDNEVEDAKGVSEREYRILPSRRSAHIRGIICTKCIKEYASQVRLKYRLP